MKKKKWWIPVLGVLILAGGIIGCGGEKEASRKDSGENASALHFQQPYALKVFEAEMLDGGTFTQENLSQKDVTVLNFWALTCGPCISEMPELAEFEKAMPDNVQVLTVCLDGRRDKERTEEVLAEAGFEGGTLISGNGDFLEIAGAIQYTPTTLIIDKDGNIVGDAIIGGQENLREAFTGAVNQALKKMGKAEIAYAEE